MFVWAQSTTKDYIRAKKKFSLSPTYSTHKSSNHKFSQIYKISPDTNLYETKDTCTNIKHKMYEELDPSVLPLFKRHIRLGHPGIVDNSVDLSKLDFLGIKKKRKWTEATTKNKYYLSAKQIAVPYGSMLDIPPTNLLLTAAKQEPCQKQAYPLTKNIETFSGAKSQVNGPASRIEISQLE